VILSFMAREVQIISDDFGFSAASRVFSSGSQLNLTRSESLIYHPQRWDKAKLEIETSSGQRSRKGIYYF